MEGTKVEFCIYRMNGSAPAILEQRVAEGSGKFTLHGGYITHRKVTSSRF
jgi:hypothetical protein